MLKVLMWYIIYKLRRFKSRESLERYQQKKIKKHLKFVCDNSEYYKKYKGNSLDEFPVIDKSEMLKNFTEINTYGISLNEAMLFAIDGEKSRDFSTKLKGLTVGLSSGTSGQRGCFLVDEDDISKWAGYVLAKLLPRGILGKYKIAFFMRADSNLYEKVKSNRIQFKFFDITSDMKESLEYIKEWKPDIIVGQPSVLLEIKDVKPEKVISIAEVLEECDAEKIKNNLGVDVIHQVYQCTEGCLGVTDREGTIRLNEDVVYIEKQYIDEHRFIPIITDFTRRAQPIIRYRLNDILVESDNKDSMFTGIQKIEGREDDVFIFKGINGNTVKVFPDSIRRCIMLSGEVKEYRCVQESIDRVIVYCDKKYWHSISEELMKLTTSSKNTDEHFVLGTVEFREYRVNTGRKMKRVEREWTI